MNKKNIFDMLENAEDDSMDILTDNCPDVSDEQLERLLSESERRYTMKKEEIERNKNIANTENTEQNEEIVSGVDRVKRPVWVRPLALAASVVLIAGTVVGSVALMKNTKPEKNNKSQATQTEAVTTTQTTIKKEEIDQDYILALTQNFTDNFDRLYVKYTKDFSSDLSEYDISRIEFEVQFDKQNAFKWKKTTFITGNKTGSLETNYHYDYDYAGRSLNVSPDLNTCDLHHDKTPLESDLFSYLFGADSLKSDTKDKWSITGYDTVCGKECAVVEVKESNLSAKIFIDIKTGVIMKEIDDYDATIENRHEEYEVTEIRYDDEAGDFVTPPEFKKFLEDGNYNIDYYGNDPHEPADLDLSFLDMPQGQQASTSSAVTSDETATESVTVPATEAETEDVPQEKTFAEAETESAQPATQAPAEIDKDYILDLVSNRKNNINRVYAKVKMCDENYDEVEKVKEVDGYDVTIQYDKDKDCFCEYVNDETSDRHSQIDMIMYKEKWVAVYKWLKNYHIISDIGAHAVTDRIDLYTRGKCSYPTLEQTLAKKNKWSITGRETVNGKDCAVVEYINKEHEIEDPVKYVMYIDIKTGIVMKSNATHYANALCKEEEAWGKSSFEITELKLNDDAPEIVPSDFKKFIKDGGFEPEDEESKDLSFLDN